MSERLVSARQEAVAVGSAQARERQAARGKLTPRERIERLADLGTFREIDLFARRRAKDIGINDGEPYTDGVICGFARVDGRRLAIYAQDPAIVGGSLGEVGGRKVVKLMDQAVAAGVPIVGINDGGGARIQEGVAALAAYGAIFARNASASGVVPQISVILGAATGGAVYSPAMTDFVFMVEGSAQMSITGPDVVRSVTGETVSLEELGGARTHATRSGVAHFMYPDEGSCLDAVRRLLSFLPSSYRQAPPPRDPHDDPERDVAGLERILPDNPTDPYDVRALIRAVFDDGELFEVAAGFAPNMVCGLARLAGHPVAVVANQPAHLAGMIDIDASEKAARFVRTADAFGLPLAVFVDAPGFRPGADQEHGGVIRRGAKLLYAFAEATVPTVQVITRQAYGAAAVVMGSSSIGADRAVAWDGATVAVLGLYGLAERLFREEISSAADRDLRRTELIQRYRVEEADAVAVASKGFLDDVIEPSETRRYLADAFDLLRHKERPEPMRKHGNVPL
ncbi:MAG TPA: acyl-CoA carboxylase subunit beta [Acidimicrobiales bacterium]|nr:acyl-CoA carboxylase subunit beta [Acidimicrobiales bacterium]